MEGRRLLRAGACEDAVEAEDGVRGVELAGFHRRAAERRRKGDWKGPALNEAAAPRVRKGDCRNESGGLPKPLRSRLFLRDSRAGAAAATGSGNGRVGVGVEVKDDAGCWEGEGDGDGEDSGGGGNWRLPDAFAFTAAVCFGGFEGGAGGAVVEAVGTSVGLGRPPRRPRPPRDCGE